MARQLNKAREYLDDGDLLKTADLALIKMNHKTLEDVKELIEKRITELNGMVHNGMLAQQKQDNAQGARAELKYQLAELEKLKV